MNILVAVAWVWMAAQHSHIEGAVCWPPSETCTVETVNGRPVPAGCRVEHIITAEGTSINTRLCGENAEIHPAAEHVIEIRTKRHATGKVRACYYLTAGQVGDPCEIIEKPTYCPSGASCQDLYDVTREIWIDGKKWGVLEESGQ